MSLNDFDVINAECEQCANTIKNGDVLTLGDLADVTVNAPSIPLTKHLYLSQSTGGGALQCNTFLGVNAGLPMSSGLVGATGSNDVIIGTNAGLSATSLFSSVLIGCAAGTSATTSSDLIAIGNQAGDLVSGAVNSTVLIGSLAGRRLAPPAMGNTDSVMIGYLAGLNVTTGQYNTLVGRAAGSGAVNPTTGSNNTVMGWNAAQNIGAAVSDTTAIGYFAGRNIEFGFCTFVGSGAGQNVTTGGGNTCLGYNALAGISTASGNQNGNVAIGNSAGRNLGTNSNLNVIIGANCVDNNNGLVQNTISSSVVIGQGTLRGLDNTPISNNVVIGRQAGQALQNLGGPASATASDNVIIGQNALGIALANPVGAARNVIIGSNAAPLLTGSGAGVSGNVFIGNGIAPTFDGANANVGSHIWIGNQAGTGLTAQLTNNAPSIIIGAFNNFTSPTNFLTGGNIAIGASLTGGLAGSPAYSNTTFLGNNVAAGVNPVQSNALYITQGLFAQNSVNLQYNAGTGLVSQPVSSLRYKENVRPLEVDSSKIYQLSAKTFEYKPQQGGSTDFGFIAEEVDPILPQVVSYDGENLPSSIRYDMFTPLLLEELKKLRAEFDAYVAAHP